MIYAELPDEFTLTLRVYFETVPKIKTASPIHYVCAHHSTSRVPAMRPALMQVQKTTAKHNAFHILMYSFIDFISALVQGHYHAKS